ncbi:MAG: SsrA-binding protein [Waddliaceae bacterium]|nr:SsrA-binding protein [Waddliaceae bacterium]
MAKTNSDLCKNRRAFHDYEVLEDFEGGLVLKGTEVKSLRDHGGSLQESYIKAIKGEIWLVGASIAPYKFGNIHNHEERRDRKILLHKKEIEKLQRMTQEKGLTMVPLAIYLNKRGKIKLKFAIARGKKLYDKRQAIKGREEKRAIDRALKNY